MNAQFRWHHIFYLHTFVLDKFRIRLPSQAIPRTFNLQPKNLRHALQKRGAIPKGSGEHASFEDDPGERLFE
jgi:hypothetical protein